MDLKKIKDSLFSPKEMYKALCDKQGRLPLVGNVSEHLRRKKQYENLHLMDGFELTKEHGLPILQPYNGTISTNAIVFSKRNKVKNKEDVFVHFFQDDYKWKHAMWDKLEKSVFDLKDFAGIYAPDFSLYVDCPKCFNISQLMKNRVATAYMQNIGYNVVPTASFGDVYSLSYCYEGLPEKSILGICGTGLESRQHRNAWEYCVAALVEQKSPTLLVVYGNPVNVSGFDVPFEFIPDELSKFHRYGKGR